MTPSNVSRLISAVAAVLLVAAGALLFFLGVPDQGTLAVAAGIALAGGLGTALLPGVRKQPPQGEEKNP